MLFICGCWLLGGISCTPQAPPLSPIPELTVLKISPSIVQEFDNGVVLELEYLDYDGDLGSENPDTKTLWVLDSRLDSADLYHVPPIAPIGQEVAIRGTFTVPIKTLFLLGNGQSEDLFFTVKIKDRAGNWSEEESTETITIQR
ncbi:MAG: hypothetical protein AAF587_40420 [Bacteroidota bacterium]